MGVSESAEACKEQQRDTVSGEAPEGATPIVAAESRVFDGRVTDEELWDPVTGPDLTLHQPVKPPLRCSEMAFSPGGASSCSAAIQAEGCCLDGLIFFLATIVLLEHLSNSCCLGAVT